jgi:hypothetical protein
MPNRPRQSGEFCWINIITPEPEKSKEFFSKILGWKWGEIPGHGDLIQVSDEPIGGLFDLANPNTPPGTPPHIGLMVKVDNADAVCDKVKSLGGKFMPAFNIGENGRMACCFDPNGGRFDLWQPINKPGMQVDAMLHGAPSWFETMTTDTNKATKFYAALFGWSASVKNPMGFDYTHFSLNGQPVAGLMQLPPGMENIPPHWSVCFTVSDVEKAARDSTAAGGKVCMEPADIPGVGRFANITSPQGVHFSVIQYTAKMA